MVGSLFSVVQGVEFGLTLTLSQRSEDTVRAGRNDFLTPLFQIRQGVKTLDFLDKVHHVTGLLRFSWVERSIIWLTPALLVFLKKTTMIPDKMRPALTFFQDHLGTLYHITAVVSSVALLFFGHTFFAISSLSILGMGVMERNGCVPVEFRQFLHQFESKLCIVVSLVCGGFVDRAFVLLLVFVSCARYLLPKDSSRENREDFVFRENLTPQIARAYLGGRLPDQCLNINRTFLYYNPSPPIPNVDIQLFIDQFDRIPWDSQIETLRAKLKNDARFMEKYSDPNEIPSDVDIIRFARDSLQALITEVKECRILHGEPRDYEKLHNYLRIIAKWIEGQNEVTQVDAIFRLAVEGGEYCGAGKFEVVESVYASTTMGDNHLISLRDKIVSCLQDERNAWMQRLYFEAVVQNLAFVGRVIDQYDVHNYNAFANHFDCDGEFGLRKAAADNDDLARVDPLTKSLYSYFYKEELRARFWAKHGVSHHAQIVTDAIGASALPKPEIYDFWREWIRRQSISESQKEALEEELGCGKLYGCALETKEKITPKFVTLMLLDMGIVEVDPNFIWIDNASEDSSDSE